MQNFTFIPNWYTQKLQGRKIQKLKMLVLLVLITDVCMTFITYRSYRNLEEFKVNINNIEARTISLTRQQPKLARVATVNTYNSIEKLMGGNIQLIFIEISEKDVIIEARTKDRDCYLGFIKNIEEVKGFPIKHFSIPELKEGYFYFKITMGII